MNKKQKNYICVGVAALIIIIGVVYMLIPRTTYADYVPEQAKAVVQIEAAELQGLALGKALPEGFSPETCGIDWTQPVYAFITPNEYIGVTAALTDESGVSAQINSLISKKECQLLDSDCGQHWAWLTSGWLLTWNEHSVLALGPGVAQERDILRQTMNHLLEGDEPFAATDRYDELMKQKGNVRIFAQLDALPSPYNLLFRLDLPADCDPAAVHLYAGAEIGAKANQGGTTSINCTLTAEDDAVLQQLDACDAQKKSLTVPPTVKNDSTLFVMATQTKGKELLSLLKSNRSIRDLLLGINQAIEFNRIAEQTDGLLCLEISRLTKDWEPTFCLKAEAKDLSAFDNADKKKEGEGKQEESSVKRVGDCAYELRSESKQLRFGANKEAGLYYFCSPAYSATAAKPMAFGTEDKADGMVSYFHVNLHTLFAQPALQDGAVANILKMLFPDARSVTYESHKGRKAKLVLRQ